MPLAEQVRICRCGELFTPTSSGQRYCKPCGKYLRTKRQAPKAAHHRGSYDRRSRELVARAKADPTTRCTCGRTLAEHPPTRDRGNPPRWSAGHVVKGEVNGALVPQVLGCNVAEENDHRNAQRRGDHVSTDW